MPAYDSVWNSSCPGSNNDTRFFWRLRDNKPNWKKISLDGILDNETLLVIPSGFLNWGEDYELFVKGKQVIATKFYT